METYFYNGLNSEGFLDENNWGSSIGKYIDNPEYIQVTLDKEDKVLEGIKLDGTHEFYTPVSFGENKYYVYKAPDWLMVIIDNEDRILAGIKPDGKTYIADFEGIDIDSIKREIKKYVDDISSNIKELSETFEYIDDVEKRSELKLDASSKIISYREDDGTLIENAGIETKKIHTDNLDLSEEGMEKFQKDLKDSGFVSKGAGNWSDYISNDGKNPLYIPEPRCAKINIISDYDLTKLSKAGYGGVEGVNWNIPTEVEFWDMQGNYFKKWTLMSAQGAFSMSVAKKNIALDFFDNSVYDSKGKLGKGDALKIKFGDWVPQDSFHLKSYYFDAFNAVCPITYKLFEDISKTRGVSKDRIWKRALIDADNITQENPNVADVSEELLSLNNEPKCFPAGFPCIVYQNGEFWGIYSLQLKKNRDNYALNKSAVNNVHLDGVINETSILGANGDASNIVWDNGSQTGFEIRNPKDLYVVTTEEVSGPAYEDITGTEEAEEALAQGNYTEVSEKPSDWSSSDIYEKFGDNPPQYCYRTSKSKMYKLVELSGYQYTKYDPDFNAAELIDSSMPYYDSKNKDHVRTDQVKRVLLNLSRVLTTVEEAAVVYENSEKTPEDLQTFKGVFETYFDVETLTDYVILSDCLYNYDGFSRNWQWVTYDGIKWYICIYDCDYTFGYAGPRIVGAPGNHQCTTMMYKYLFKYYISVVEERYAELRNCKILTTNYIIKYFNDWVSRYGNYNYELEFKKWGDYPGVYPYRYQDNIIRVSKWLDKAFKNMDSLYNYNND